MSTNPPTPDSIDPTWNLPEAPTRGQPVSGATFARLLAAARKGGWPAVFVTFAEGETTVEPTPSGTIHERPRRRRVLGDWLNKRSDLKLLLDTACQERRDRLLSQLEDEVERIALGPGDVTQDFDDKGRLKRTRVDRRNKLYAALKLLASHDPQTYAERRKVDVEGQIDHRHAHAHLVSSADPGGYRIDLEALQRLPLEEQQQLFRLLDKVETARLEQAREQRPALPSGQHRNGDTDHE